MITEDARRLRKGKEFCETIGTLSDAEICFRVGKIIDDRDELAGLLTEAVTRMTHDPYCHHNDRMQALRRCDCGRDEIAERIQVALRGAGKENA